MLKLCFNIKESRRYSARAEWARFGRVKIHEKQTHSELRPGDGPVAGRLQRSDYEVVVGGEQNARVASGDRAGAMDLEVKKFASRLDNVSVERVGGWTFWRGTLDGYPVIVSKTLKW